MLNVWIPSTKASNHKKVRSCWTNNISAVSSRKRSVRLKKIKVFGEQTCIYYIYVLVWRRKNNIRLFLFQYCQYVVFTVTNKRTCMRGRERCLVERLCQHLARGTRWWVTLVCLLGASNLKFVHLKFVQWDSFWGHQTWCKCMVMFQGFPQQISALARLVTYWPMFWVLVCYSSHVDLLLMPAKVREALLVLGFWGSVFVPVPLNHANNSSSCICWQELAKFLPQKKDPQNFMEPEK